MTETDGGNSLMKILRISDLRMINHNNLNAVDMGTLIKLHRASCGRDRYQCMVTLLLVMKRFLMDKDRAFPWEWIIDHIGQPDFYRVDGDRNCDFYYVCPEMQLVALVVIRNSMFSDYGVIGTEQFYERILCHCEAGPFILQVQSGPERENRK